MLHIFIRERKGTAPPPGQTASKEGGRANAAGVVKRFALVIILVQQSARSASHPLEQFFTRGLLTKL